MSRKFYPLSRPGAGKPLFGARGTPRETKHNGTEGSGEDEGKQERSAYTSQQVTRASCRHPSLSPSWETGCWKEGPTSSCVKASARGKRSGLKAGSLTDGRLEFSTMRSFEKKWYRLGDAL